MANGKYQALTKHLDRKVEGQWATYSFGELKKILGFSLPKSAWDHQAWWGNHHGNSQAKGWMDAGFEVEAVNLTAGTVRFVRRGGSKETRPQSSLLVVKTTQRPTHAVDPDEGCHLDLSEIRQSIAKAAELAGADVPVTLIEASWSLVPHKKPSSLPDGKQAIYCFFVGTVCLKVGKVGPRNTPRYISHHYHCSSTSSLAKSILKSSDRIVRLISPQMQEELQTCNEENIGRWIVQHTSRLNLLLPETLGPHVLSLVEGFLHVRLQPIFEGAG